MQTAPPAVWCADKLIASLPHKPATTITTTCNHYNNFPQQKFIDYQYRHYPWRFTRGCPDMPLTAGSPPTAPGVTPTRWSCQQV
jgi:hypothetical protein